MKIRSVGPTGLLVFLTSCGGGAEMGAPIGGQLLVTTHTTGSTGDVVSYTVIVVGITEQPVPVNGTATLNAIGPGDHTVELSGIPVGCTVGDNPRTVKMRGWDETGSTTFEITCVAELEEAVRERE